MEPQVSVVGGGIGECPPFFLVKSVKVSSFLLSLSVSRVLSVSPAELSLPCPNIMSFQARDAGFVSWTNISFKH